MPHGTVLLVPALAGQPGPGLSGRAEGDPVQPVAQQVRVSDRAGSSGQHEEDGLKGVFGVLAIDQKLPADAQHHRTVPGDQRREGLFPGGVAARDEPLEELTIGQSGNRAAAVRATQSAGPPMCVITFAIPCAPQQKSRVSLILSLDTARMMLLLSQVFSSDRQKDGNRGRICGEPVILPASRSGCRPGRASRPA